MAHTHRALDCVALLTVSLIAVIIAVAPSPRSCRITVDCPDTADAAGATTLRILNPTWTPNVGMAVTGGRAYAVITAPSDGDEPSHRYRRSGFNILHEEL